MTTIAAARSIDPISNPEWLALVESSPTAQVFHHPRWLSLLSSQYGYELQACCVDNGNGIEAGMPIARIESRLTGRRLVSLPFSDACAPALRPGAGPAAAEAMVAALAEEGRRTGLSLAVHGPLPEGAGVFVQHRFVRHLLPLDDDYAEVERRFSKSQVKRGIKKARREGLTTERRTDAGALDAFYSLHLKTRRRLGVPTQPKAFIRGLEGLFEGGLGFLQLVLDSGRPIAAGVFLTYKDTVTYKYGASDAGSLGKRPNNLLFAEVIRWACGAGFRTLDFGRTDLDNEGLKSFKRSWGANESALPYTYLADSEPAVGHGLRDRVMGVTIRRSPPVVGRLAGEALYGHFG